MEETIGSNLLFQFQQCFVALTPKARETKAKIKQDYTKIKSFGTVKETVIKTKKPPTEFVKMFANYIFNNFWLISKMLSLNS